MIGSSEAFRAVQSQIEKIAAFGAPLLIEGETGTGKELAARSVHYLGARRDGPFVPVNCGAIPDQLIENELFGHRRGAFTGAREEHRGLVEHAQGGTLFLDEVDALTPKGQVTLLRFLQDHQFRPLGESRERKSDVRIIAASNRGLEQQVERGEFRQDLLYRIKLMYLRLPPLRDRRGDIAVLAEHFVRGASTLFGKPPLPIDPATLDWFEAYHWPGNIRELENVLHREFLLAAGETISIPPPAGDLAAAAAGERTLNFRRAKSQAITEFERRYLARLIERANGNVSEAARLGGTERRHLGRLLKKHHISRARAARP